MPINEGYCVQLGNLGRIGQIPIEFCSSIEDQGPLGMEEQTGNGQFEGSRRPMLNTPIDSSCEHLLSIASARIFE